MTKPARLEGLGEWTEFGKKNRHFDFNSTKPTSASLAGVDFIVKYLKNNPSRSADIVGYAD